MSYALSAVLCTFIAAVAWLVKHALPLAIKAKAPVETVAPADFKKLQDDVRTLSLKVGMRQ